MKLPNILAPSLELLARLIFRDHGEHQRDEQREEDHQPEVARHYFRPSRTS